MNAYVVNYNYLAAVSFDSTAVVNLLATASATSDIRAGELPCRAKKKEEKKIEQGELIKIGGLG